MRVRCPSCSARLNARPHLAGERVPCPKCGKKVLVPDPDDLDADEADDTEPARKLVYVRQKDVSAANIPAIISLVLGVLALCGLAVGWFTTGWMYVAAVAVSLIGLGLGFMGKGNLRIADCALNFLILLPAVVASALLLAGVPVTQRARALANRPSLVETLPEAAPIEDSGPVQPVAGPKWIDAAKGEPVKVGNVLVRIGDVRMGVAKSVDIGKALESLDPSKILQPDNNGGVTEQPAILIDVQVGNPSETVKLELKRWSKSRGGDVPKLADNFKNSYKPISSQTDILNMMSSQQAGAASIMPQTTTIDTLTFEAPIEKAQSLFLQVPAENFGGQGTLYFKIPRGMIQPAR